MIRNIRQISNYIGCWKLAFNPNYHQSIVRLATDSGSSGSNASSVTFASLFRDSPLCQLGLPENKVVIGEIVDVVEDDIYIDFGFKFHAVCRRPKQNALSYSRGAQVKIRINDLELSDRFLGSNQDMTLLEADCTLLGLHSTPVKMSSQDGDQHKQQQPQMSSNKQQKQPSSMTSSTTIIKKKSTS